MPEEDSQSTNYPKSETSKKNFNWKVLTVLVVGVLILAALAYAGTVLNLFGQRDESVKQLLKTSTSSSSKKEDSKEGEKDKTSNKGKVAFIRDDEIYIMEEDGSNQEKIVSEKRLWSNLSWSPDGTKLGFSGLIDEPGYFRNEKDLFIYDFSSKKLIRLTTSTQSNKIGAEKLSWAPDSKRYSFIRQDSTEVNIANTSGENVARIPLDGYDGCHSISWAPTGEKSVLTCDRDTVIVSSNKDIQKIKDSDIASVKPGSILGLVAVWGKDDKELLMGVKKGPLTKVFLIPIKSIKDMKQIPTASLPVHNYELVLGKKTSRLALVEHVNNEFISEKNRIVIVNLKGNVENANLVELHFDYDWNLDETKLLVRKNNADKALWAIDLTGNKKKILDSLEEFSVSH